MMCWIKFNSNHRMVSKMWSKVCQHSQLSSTTIIKSHIDKYIRDNLHQDLACASKKRGKKGVDCHLAGSLDLTWSWRLSMSTMRGVS